MLSIKELNEINPETLKVLIDTGCISKSDFSFDIKEEAKPEEAGRKEGLSQKIDDKKTVKEQNLIPTSQAASILGYRCLQSVYNLRVKGIIMPVDINGTLYWNLDDILSYKKARDAKINSEEVGKCGYAVKVVDRLPKEYWTSKEVCEYLGIEYDNTSRSRNYINKMTSLKRQGLKSYKIKNHNKIVFFVPDEVREFAEKNGLKAPSEKKTAPCITKHPFIINNERIDALNNYENWSKELRHKASKAGVDFGKACSECFKNLNRIYGINVEIAKRSYYKDKGIYPSSSLRTMFYVQYEQPHKESEHYENLFENEMDKYIETHK